MILDGFICPYCMVAYLCGFKVQFPNALSAKDISGEFGFVSLHYKSCSAKYKEPDSHKDTSHCTHGPITKQNEVKKETLI